jgi:hypothetical protein
MKPYKAVVCALNSRYIHVALAPLYLQAGVRKFCDAETVSIAIVEGTVNEPQEVVLARLEAESPNLIGLSCYIWNIEKMLSLAFACKSAHPEVAIVLAARRSPIALGSFLRSILFLIIFFRERESPLFLP